MAQNSQNIAPGSLSKYFPEIYSRKQVLQIIHSQKNLNALFQSWNPQDQETFLDCCSGSRGMKVLYDGIFKEIFNPEAAPERLEDLLSLLFQKKVKIDSVLPNDSVRLGAESSLLYTDIIVQLEDGSLSNIEIQKIGYAFPGQRCACYSADHLLRQYKRVRGAQGKQFHYRNIKSVYTIIFFEQSPKEFHDYPDHWLHIFRQQSNTGLTLNLLQEYYFIPLDIFRKNMDNKSITSDLEAWLSFLSFDEPERIVELFTRYPRFRALYQDIYELCQNMEKVMNMYSKELLELDHNTVLYMIDEMQEQIDQKQLEITEMDAQISQQKVQIHQQVSQINQQVTQINQQEAQINQQEAQINQQEAQINQQEAQINQQAILIQNLQKQLADLQSSK